MAAIEQIKELVKNHRVPKVIGLGGLEQALLNEAQELLRSEILADGDAALNYHKYDASENLPNSWLASAQTVPFLAQKRLIEVFNAEKLSINDVGRLLEYMRNPADFSVLVLIFSKLDKRNKLVSAFLAQKLLFEFSQANNNEILSLIREDIKKYNIKINQENINFLLIMLDNNLLLIRAALKKISLIYENQEPTLEQISAQITGDAVPDVFKLVRFISEGKLKESLYTLGLLRKSQENAIKFLGVLSWQLRVLLHIRHCLDRGMAEWDIRKEVSVYGDRFSWMLLVAKKRSITFHSNRLTRLMQCDLALKSQKIAEPLTLIEKVIYQSAVGIEH